MYNILVCDDDREIVDAIEIYLTQEGYHVLKAYDGMQAIQMLEREEIQLLIIDVMMPKLDGIRATLKIREKSSIPIIILSAKSEDVDKILGLNIGADDYVTKPFNPLELVARVKSQLRRYTKLGNLPADDGENVYQVGGLLVKKCVSGRGSSRQRRFKRSQRRGRTSQTDPDRIQHSPAAGKKSRQGIFD